MNIILFDFFFFLPIENAQFWCCNKMNKVQLEDDHIPSPSHPSSSPSDHDDSCPACISSRQPQDDPSSQKPDLSALFHCAECGTVVCSAACAQKMPHQSHTTSPFLTAVATVKTAVTEMLATCHAKIVELEVALRAFQEPRRTKSTTPSGIPQFSRSSLRRVVSHGGYGATPASVGSSRLQQSVLTEEETVLRDTRDRLQKTCQEIEDLLRRDDSVYTVLRLVGLLRSTLWASLPDRPATEFTHFGTYRLWRSHGKYNAKLKFHAVSEILYCKTFLFFIVSTN